MKRLIILLAIITAIGGGVWLWDATNLSFEEWQTLKPYNPIEWRIGPYQEGFYRKNGYPIVQIRNNWVERYYPTRESITELRVDTLLYPYVTKWGKL